MPFPLALTQSEYETLIAFARKGTLEADGTINQDRAQGLESWLRGIEQKNGITRNFVLVQWQEQDAPLPPGVNFPTKWPPEMRTSISLISRAIARADVDAVLKAKAKKPTSVLVTRDPAGQVGWTALDEFFK